MTSPARILPLSLLLLALAVAPPVAARRAAAIPATAQAALRWRLIGPFRSGRVLAVSGVRGNPNLFYFGAVGGGVWKTSNAGRTWTPIFDGEDVASIGALAVAPSDPRVIYVGTGEADMRSDITMGQGVYKSTDGGATWRHLGLDDTMQIGRILVDPRNPDVVLVAALGHAYAPNPERGVFRSTDGGRTWTKTLYEHEDVGAIDLAMAPDNPQVVFASLWSARRTPWSRYPPVNGPGSGLYRSTDGGVTWSAVAGHGLPTTPLGRIGVAVASSTGRVYAIVDAARPGLYRSDDGGANWELVGTDPRITSRAWYFSEVTIDPRDPDVVYVPNISLYRSRDGGRTFEAIKGAPGGDDYHQLWIAPEDPARMIVGVDQGATISVDGGRTWSSWYNQPIAQMYHVAVDNRFPYWVYGAQQDSGTAGVASRGNYGAVTPRDWQTVGGGESGYIVPDPTDPDVIYGGSTYGDLFRFVRSTGQVQDITPWPEAAFGAPRAGLKYRFDWTAPLVFSPQDPHTLYYGAQAVLKTTDGGMSWTAISPDLARAERHGTPAGGAMVDALAPIEAYGVVYTLASSPVAKGLIWAGTDDGLIHLTRDEGAHWQDVTPPSLQPWSKVSLIEASPHDPGAACAAIDRHRLDDYAPHILRTRDYGATWTAITTGISDRAFVRAVREDPVRRGLLYAGTELGVFVSYDDGDAWEPLQLNLPVTPVRDLVVKGDDLVIATHGRSFWILDDVTPLRQLSEAVVAEDLHLFRPQTAIRMQRSVNTDTPLPPETPLGENPPDGAIVDFWLKRAPMGPVTIEILDQGGTLVRRLSSDEHPGMPEPRPAFPDSWLRPAPPVTARAGLNRVVWDLRYPKPAVVSSSYTIAAVAGRDTPALPLGPQVVPGTYQVRVTADGRSQTVPLTVKMDPRVTATAEDLAAQLGLEQAIVDAIARDRQALDEARRVIAQIAERKTLAAAAALMETLDAVTAKASKSAADLTGLNNALGALLVVVDGADARPTTQAAELFQVRWKALDAALTTWETTRSTDLAALSAALRRAGLPLVGTDGPK